MPWLPLQRSFLTSQLCHLLLPPLVASFPSFWTTAPPASRFCYLLSSPGAHWLLSIPGCLKEEIFLLWHACSGIQPGWLQVPLCSAGNVAFLLHRNKAAKELPWVLSNTWHFYPPEQERINLHNPSALFQYPWKKTSFIELWFKNHEVQSSFFFCSVGARTLLLTHTGQMLHHWAPPLDQSSFPFMCCRVV